MPVSASNLSIQENAPVEECVPGALLGGKYRVERLLGEGGMANVWLARNEFLDMPVAIKVVRAEIRGSEAAARLHTEARVQANLRHPNVARVYDYGKTASGDAYLVMELLEGRSLAEWIEVEGALSPVFAVQLLLPVIDALCAAHRAGVVHRDLKPDNIFITLSDGVPCPKLLDFGIAKLDDECHPRLTGRGGVLGSPAYMAPEQARGLDDLDQRVDVWAACVVLYESLTGAPAFDADNYNALMLQVIEYEPPPLEAAKYDDLWPIIAGGLKKDRESRTETMLELGAQLASWLDERGAIADLGGEPLGWRWAFSSREASGVVARVRPRLSPVPSRTPTPPRALNPRQQRAGVVTLAVPPHAARRDGVMRVLLAACAGAAMLVAGVTHGPAWWSSAEPKPAVAHAEAALPQLAAAVPLQTEPAPFVSDEHAAHASAMPAVRAPAKPSAAPVRAAPPPPPAPEPQQPVLRVNTETSKPEIAASATEPARAEPSVISLTTVYPADRALDAYPPAVEQHRAAAPVRTKVVRRPSEAELGLKNPW